MSLSETLELLTKGFDQDIDPARKVVFALLQGLGYTEPQLFDAIERHAKELRLNSEQWLRIFQMYPNPVFRSRFDLTRLLSENDQKRLDNHDQAVKF